MADFKGKIPPLDKLPPEWLHESVSHELIIVNTVVLVFSTVLLGLRLYARSLTNARRGWDEFLLPPAWLLLVALIVLNYVAVPEAGVGKHFLVLMNISPQKPSNFAKFIYIVDWFYVLSTVLSRIAVVVLYLRVFTSKVARFFCWAVIAFLIAFFVTTMIVAHLECVPFEFIWDKTIVGGTCFDQITWWQLTNLPNIIADTIILLLPQRTIWTLKAPLARKLEIFGVCLLGSVGLIVSCVRTSWFYVYGDQIASDPTWLGSDCLILTVFEAGMYFSCSCLVGLRPVLQRFLQSLRSRGLIKSRATQSDRVIQTISGKRSIPLRSYGQNKTEFDDSDSTTRIVPYGNNVEINAPGSYITEPAPARVSHAQPSIRVDTEVRINSDDRSNHHDGNYV